MKNIFDIKSFLVFLGRNKAYTLINVLGLALSFMFVILIALYTTHEVSIDKSETNLDRICVLGHEMMGEHFTGGHWKIQPRLKSRYPEIENSFAFAIEDGRIEMPDGKWMSVTEGFADSSILSILDFPIVQGDRTTALDATNSIIISRKIANAAFGNENPVGQPLKIDGMEEGYRVTAVFDEDYLKTSSLRDFDVLMRFENVGNSAMLDDFMSNATGAEIFILTKPGTDFLSKTDDLKAFFTDIWWFYEMDDLATEPLLIPLREVYFSDTEGANRSCERGSRRLVNILFAAGLVILLFSIINYINLTVSQSTKRAKEMATRRLVGSQRSEIVARLLCESVLICFISLVIGAVLAWVFVPFENNLLQTELDRSLIYSPAYIGLLLLASLILGIISGITPAIVISRTKPVDIVRGTFRLQSKLVFSKVLIVFQNLATIVMVAVTITVILQTNHLINAPLGFETKNLLEIPNPGDDSLKMHTFANEVEKLACVEKLTFCAGTPKQGGNNNTQVINGKTISNQVFIGDQNYMDVFGLKLKRDNNTGGKNPTNYVNSLLLSELGLDDTAESCTPFTYEGPMRIDGVLEDFQIRAITQMNTPHPYIVYIYDRTWIRHPWSFVMRVTGDLTEAYRDVAGVYEQVYNETLDLTHPFIEDQVQADFENEKRTSTILAIFAGIAILISFLGLVAMSTYFIEQRKKEIALKKVFGSTSGKVMSELVWSFMKFVVIAFIIAVPVIWYFMREWLANYPYRISLSPWIFIAAGIFALVVSFIAVFVQSKIAAEKNPVIGIAEE